jgi:hypothetical protein
MQSVQTMLKISVTISLDEVQCQGGLHGTGEALLKDVEGQDVLTEQKKPFWMHN